MLSACVSVGIHVSTCIYIERERERERVRVWPAPTMYKLLNRFGAVLVRPGRAVDGHVDVVARGVGSPLLPADAAQGVFARASSAKRPLRICL